MTVDKKEYLKSRGLVRQIEIAQSQYAEFQDSPEYDNVIADEFVHGENGWSKHVITIPIELSDAELMEDIAIATHDKVKRIMHCAIALVVLSIISMVTIFAISAKVHNVLSVFDNILNYQNMFGN